MHTSQIQEFILNSGHFIKFPKRALEQQPNTKHLLKQRHAAPANGFRQMQHDSPRTALNMGETYNTNKDLSTSSLLLRRSFASFAIRNFGIHDLCLSSFSLRGGREKHCTNSGFASRMHPLPKPRLHKAMIFPCLPPAPTQTQTCARFAEAHAASTIIWQAGTRHAVSINSNFSDKELARTSLIISTGSWAFPSLEKRSQLCRVAASSSLLFTSLALCNVKEAFGGGDVSCQIKHTSRVHLDCLQRRGS